MDSSIASWFISNLTWDVLYKLLRILIVSIVPSLGLRLGFGLLADWKRFLAVCLCIFVSSVTLLIVFGQPIARPLLRPEIDWVAYGGEMAGPQTGGAFVTLAVTIVNIGSMPSIAHNFEVEAKVEGRTYKGELMTLPEILDLGVDAVITSYGKDNRDYPLYIRS